tara:strand:- start:969 stop:1844 length:876 start_codon:yes stop_codon:yes gene_type:complete
MKINKNSVFLHPILDQTEADDRMHYTNGSFNLDISSAEDVTWVKINPILNQDDLEKLLKENKATLFVLVECLDTSIRHRYEIKNKQETKLTFPKGTFRKSVSIQGFMSLTEEIKNFSSVSFIDQINKIQKNHDIGKGELMAMSNIKEIIIDDDRVAEDYWEFSIKPGLGNKMDVYLEEDIAQIQLSEEMYNTIKEIRGKYENSDIKGKKLLKLSLYLNAFQHAIGLIQDDKRAYNSNESNLSGLEGRSWYIALDLRLEQIKDKDWDDSSFLLAQKVLSDPFSELSIFKEEI